MANAGTFIEVNTPLVTAGTVSNSGVIVGDVNNSGNFVNNSVVTGAFTNAGLLSGNGVVGSLALLPGSTIAPGNSIGTVQVIGNLSMAAGATYQAQVGTNTADLIQVGGTATLSGGTIVASSIGNAPILGSSLPILTATGGISGSFNALTEPTTGLAAGTRFDALYGSNMISLVVTPSFYGNLATAGIAESASESAVGGALDAIRPAPGLAMNAAQSTLFTPLYALPASSITTALDELAPSIYADGLITARNSWYLMANTIGAQLAVRRGLAPGQAADGAPGPNGSTIWATGLAGYYTTGAGGGAPGFTAGLGGAAVGIDMPVFGSGRVGLALGSVDGQTWSQTGGNATSTTALVSAYGQWQSGIFFAEAQAGTMYLQENVQHSLPIFGASARGSTNGLAGGGGIRLGVQQILDAWLIEPSVGFGGFGYHQDSLTESGTTLTEAIGGASIGSAESTVSVSAQRNFALSDTMQMVAKARLGWSHEFASNTGSVTARFTGLSGGGFQLNSAPIGRDAALVGLGADFKIAACPLAMYVRYDGAISGGSNAQAFNAGLRFTW